MGRLREACGLHKTLWQGMASWHRQSRVGKESKRKLGGKQSFFPLFLPWVPLSGAAREAGSLGRTDMVFYKKQMSWSLWV